MDTTSGTPVTELRNAGYSPPRAVDEPRHDGGGAAGNAQQVQAARSNPRPLRAGASRRPQAAEAGDSPIPLSVSIDSLSHRFDELEVTDELSLHVDAGEVLGIVGPSGSGKTTLLELIAGLREASGPGLDVDGETRPGIDPEPAIAIGGSTSPTDRLARCAYMPQRDLLLPWLRAIDNAAIALRNRGLGRAEARAAATPLFERFGLAGFELAHPGELSGGMRQRVAFLRTLLAGKPVLLLDEPFGALDAITRGEMQEWLTSALGEEPRTVLFVTHDVEEALYACDRVVILSPRPAAIVTELTAPAPSSASRIDAITDAEFIAVREQALERLAGSSGR